MMAESCLTIETLSQFATIRDLEILCSHGGHDPNKWGVCQDENGVSFERENEASLLRVSLSDLTELASELYGAYDSDLIFVFCAIDVETFGMDCVLYNTAEGEIFQEIPNFGQNPRIMLN